MIRLLLMYLLSQENNLALPKEGRVFRSYGR